MSRLIAAHAINTLSSPGLQITELIHVASLLHDDVIDAASTRRGLKALNVAFGNKVPSPAARAYN